MKELSIEEKELLLKDLCARLPYGVKIEGYELPCIILNSDWLHFMYTHQEFAIRRPYLRSIDSMTEEEKEEFENLLEGIVDGIERWDKPDLCEEYDWLNAHHFDYRHLIEKGLALEAPEGMYNV